MSNNVSLILFIKFPDKENVKSRLASAAGKETALALYRNFVLDISGTVKKGNYPASLFFYPPHLKEAFESWIGGDFEYIPQTGNDLGERMKNAFIRSFSAGLEKVVLIGGDIPDLSNTVIDEAFDSLDDNDSAIGPASDGGYYLIGFKKGSFAPEIFHGISWSTDSVFSQTMNIFKNAGRSVHVLPEWRDVDTIDDLRYLLERNIDTGFRNSRTMSYILKNKHAIFPG